MPDTILEEIRARYEREAVQPPFATLVERRRRRTHRQVLVAGLAVVACLSTAALVARPGGHGRPAGPAATSTLAPSTDPSVAPSTGPSIDSGAPQPSIGSLAFGASGDLYALRSSCDAPCASDGTGPHTATVLRSTDRGTTWTSVGSTHPFYSGVANLVLLGSTDMWIIQGGLAATESRNGGRTWHDWPYVQGGSNFDALPPQAAGGTVWFVVGPNIRTARAGQEPIAHTASGMESIVSMAAVDADHAEIVAVDNNNDAHWLATSDRGAHWQDMPNPCPTSRLPSVSAGPSGKLWAICSDGPVGGTQVKSLRTSTDGGDTWSATLTLPQEGELQNVYPFADGAWRTGDRSDIYHTTDGVHWTDVAPTGGPGGPGAFAAGSGLVAAYEADGKVYTTTNGGRTWQEVTAPV